VVVRLGEAAVGTYQPATVCSRHDEDRKTATALFGQGDRALHVRGMIIDGTFRAGSEMRGHGELARPARVGWVGPSLQRQQSVGAGPSVAALYQEEAIVEGSETP
jgi:hypothetical protein